MRHDPKPALAVAMEASSLQTAIPKYVVLAHFLLMIHEMDENKFVLAFRPKWMTRAQWEALKAEASVLAGELAALDSRAHAVTAVFRRAGDLALRQGKPLPPPPIEILRLQAMRTAAMVNRTVGLQTMLGPSDTLKLEAMLAYQFARGDRLDYLAHSDRQ